MGDYFINQDGQRVFKKESLVADPNNAKVNVIIIHGLHEHCDYYDELTKEFNKIGCNVFALDHVGHGRSDGPRGVISSLDIFVRDVMQLTASIKERFANAKYVVFGHSMGGLITLKMCLDYPASYNGIILEGPAFEISSPFVSIPLRLLVTIAPNMGVKSLSLEDLSTNKKAIEAVQRDPLYSNQSVRAIMALSILNAMQDVKSRIRSLDHPIFFTHGEGDKICPPKGSVYLHDHCSSLDKTLMLVPNALHQVHNEVDSIKEKYFKDVVDWITNRFIN